MRIKCNGYQRSQRTFVISGFSCRLSYVLGHLEFGEGINYTIFNYKPDKNNKFLNTLNINWYEY